MIACIVSIADTEDLARTLDRYLRSSLGSRIESRFMTYGCSLLSGPLLRQTDLFILELLRGDDDGYRAEGLMAAEKWAPIGKRVLLVSGAAQSDVLGLPFYWDLAASDSLQDRVQKLLKTPAPSVRDLAALRQVFARHCRPAVDHHKV